MFEQVSERIFTPISRKENGVLMITATKGRPTRKTVPPFRDAHNGLTRNYIFYPEFDYSERVRLPSSVSDYPRYRQTVLEARKRVLANVRRRFLKKYPIYMC